MTRRTRNVIGLAMIASLLGLSFGSPVSAGEWALVGARYQGMGGAGVATVNDSFASYWNPAALAAAQSYDAAINFDIVGSVEGNALQVIDEIEEQFEETNIDGILDGLGPGGPTPADEAILDDLVAELEKLGKSGHGVVGTGSTGLNLRWQRYAVFSRGNVEFAIDPTFDEENVEFVDSSPGANSLIDNDSGARVRGLGVIETGVGYGHTFALPVVGDVSVGANLKYLRGFTYAKFVGYRSLEDAKLDFGDSNLRKESDNFGLDLGIMYKPFDFLQVGMVARNVNSPKFKTGRDGFDPDRRKHFKLAAQVRAGAAYYPFSNDMLVIASDLDLTGNKTDLLDSYESRLWSIGAEFKVPIKVVSLALRGGGYLNTASGADHSFVLTGGLGLRVWLLTLDLAGGASPSSSEIKADGKKYPNRVNLSAVLAIRGNF